VSVPLFLEFVRKHNLDITPEKSAELTTTAAEAAKVHGVPVSNIVKSLVVKADGEFLIYLCPVDKKLDFKELSRRLGKKDVRMGTPDEVRDVTGHSIGGVSPFGHRKPLKTIIISGFDPDEPLWAAAGAVDTNFKTSLSKLQEIVKRVNLMVR